MSISSAICAESANKVKNMWVCKLNVATDLMEEANDVSDEIRFDVIRKIIKQIAEYEFAE